MSLSPAEVRRLALELAKLAGARVQKVSVTASTTALLEVRVPGETRLVRLEVAPGVSRVSLVEHKPASPEPPLSFQGLLRAHLTGARLDHVAAIADGGALALRLSTDRGARSLVVEFARNGGELLLLDANGIIIGASPGQLLRMRGLRRGEAWPPPGISDERERADRFAAVAEPTPEDPYPVSAAIEAAYGAVTTAISIRDARSSVLPALRAARKKAQRTLEKIRADRARIDEAARYQRMGDLLKPMLNTIRRGAIEVTGTEYGEQGPEQVKVPLLPHLSARENMDRYYHLHRRLSRSAAKVDDRLAELGASVAQLDALLAEAEASTTEAQLLEIGEKARHSGLLRGPSQAAPKAGEAPTRRAYREYLSATGQRIWVGRSARDNDALTFKHARGNDLWMHARGRTGSHVIVPGVGVDGPDSETLLDAATLAAHFSAGRDELVVDVGFTRRKYVQKPRGAAAGSVRYTQDRNLQLRLEPSRLERLLAAEVVEQ